MKNTFTSEVEPEHAYTWYSFGKNPYGEVSIRWSFRTAKIPYGENSVRWNFRTAKNPTAKFPTAKTPTAKTPTAKVPTAKAPSAMRGLHDPPRDFVKSELCWNIDGRDIYLILRSNSNYFKVLFSISIKQPADTHYKARVIWTLSPLINVSLIARNVSTVLSRILINTVPWKYWFLRHVLRNNFFKHKNNTRDETSWADPTWSTTTRLSHSSTAYYSLT